MISPHIRQYIKFAIQARLKHKKYGVSAEYMEIVLRIEYHRVRDNWSEERYQRELVALALKFPDSAIRHMKYFEVEKA